MRVRKLVRLGLAFIALGPTGTAWATSPASPAASAHLANAQECAGGAPPAQRAKACSALLDGPALGPKVAAELHYFRGFAHWDLARQDRAQIDLALGDFTDAVRLNPGLWPAYWVRAEIFSSRRDYARAAADWTEVIRRNPQIASLYSKRGIDLDYLGRTVDAVADFTKAIAAAGPKDPLAGFYLGRALAHEAEHHWDQMRADYDAAIRRDDRLEEAYRGRGRMEYLSGDPNAAIADLTKADELNPSDGYTFLWLFLAEARAGRDAAAALRWRASHLDQAQWPMPIIRVLLGDLRPEAVQPPAWPATWSEADRKAGADCELAFYRAELHLLKGERVPAAALFRTAVETGLREYIEYRAARLELARMAP